MGKMDKLFLLGHSEAGLSILMDMAFETHGIQTFNVIKNIDLPNCAFTHPDYSIQYFDSNAYNFPNLSTPINVQFGVQQTRIKYLLYHHFYETHGIDKNNYFSIIHPTSYIAHSVNDIKQGLLLEPMSLISSCAQIGFGVSIKRGASIGHHAQLGDFVNINPGVVLSGNVMVGAGTEIGSGSVVSNNIRIGKQCIIGAGSVVTNDIPDAVVAYGNPCRVVREINPWPMAI